MRERFVLPFYMMRIFAAIYSLCFSERESSNNNWSHLAMPTPTPAADEGCNDDAMTMMTPTHMTIDDNVGR